MAKTATGTAHRHRDSRGKWVTDELPHTHDYTEQFTAAEVTAIKVLIAGGGGGTTPVPNPPPGPTPDITAPVISGVTVSAVTTTGATISWTTNEAATGLVEYGTTTAYGTSTAATSSGTTHSRNLTGLSPGQTYQFRVRATDTAGNLGLGGNRTLTTASSVTLPGAPTGLTATGGNTQVTLNWTAPASNGGSAITGYRVYRNGASLIVLGVVLTYNNTGLTNGLTYTYTVAAITAVGEGPQSGSAFATPNAGGDINAPIPANVTASPITTTTAEIAWSLNEAGNGQVEYGLTIGYGLLSTLEAGYLLAHSQTLSSLVPNKLYHYRVRSADATGNLGLSSDRTFTTLDTTPTPSPGRRFAAPTTTVTVAVPGAIDATGATDVRAALLSFIAGLANGTRITATSGARYKISSGLLLTNRQHLVFAWTGVTLHNTGGGSSEDGCFYLDNCSDIALIGINYIGANPTPGRMSSAGEHSATVYVSDGIRIEISGGTSKDVHGDGTVTVNRDGQYVWVHDMTVTNCGRMAAAVVWGSHIWIERNTVGPCGFAIWDIEPESASNGQTMTDISFLDNDAWGWSPQSDGTLWHGFFFGASAGVGSTAIVDNIHVERNRVTGPGSTQSTIQSYIGSQNTPYGRRTNGTFLDNTGQTGPIQQAQPGLVTFRHCDTWTYGRNGAAPTSGSLYGVTGLDNTGMTAV